MAVAQTNPFFEILGSINFTKVDLMKDPDRVEEMEKAYNPYTINRLLSYFPDGLFAANEMNRLLFMEKKMQYDFLRLSLRPRKRFSKWQKSEVDEVLFVVKEYFGYSTQKAKEALRILSSDQLNYMRTRLTKGGAKGKNNVGV